jgi:hypothetical protein
MSRWVRIFVLFHDGAFRDVFASYSEAIREKHAGSCCVIKEYSREDY